MDLSFSRWDTLRTDAAPAPIDYLQLVAAVSAIQAGSRTAEVEAALAAGTFVETRPLMALVSILEAIPAMMGTPAALDGSFRPELAAKLKGPPHETR